MKYFLPLAGFELRTFNDALAKKGMFTGKGGKKYPEIHRERREKISRKFPRQVDCGLARALLET